jgi:hypothetical protein
VDVAVGCINLSPERLESTTFSLPFQEDGLAVLALRNRLDLGKAFLRSLIGPALLQLLGGFLILIGLISLLTWRVEGHGRSDTTRTLGATRSFARIFQILATGPGSNTIVETTRGHLLVLLAYLVRIVAASLLVGFLTVHVVEETRERSAGSLQGLEDLRGRRDRRAALHGDGRDDLVGEAGGRRRGDAPAGPAAAGAGDRHGADHDPRPG